MSELSNPLLQQAEDKLEAGLTPETRADYLKIVVAGMHAALDKGPDGILASLKLSKDPVADAAKGAVSLVMILRKQTQQGVMPLKAMVLAGTTLMLKALDFADRSKIVAVGAPELIRATHIFTDTIFAAFHITKPVLANLAQRVRAVTQNPAAMELVNRKAGVVRSPGATPMPQPVASPGTPLLGAR